MGVMIGCCVAVLLMMEVEKALQRKKLIEIDGCGLMADNELERIK